MVSSEEVTYQIMQLGKKPPMLAYSEYKKLPSVLMPGEQILDFCVGMYVAGYALMVATDKRLLVIDKMPGAFMFEDIHYDDIAEIEYVHLMFKTKISLATRSKQVIFTAIRKKDIRSFIDLIEDKIQSMKPSNMATFEQTTDPQATYFEQTN